MRCRAGFILAGVYCMVLGNSCAAQMPDDDVDDLKLTPITATESRLTWKPVLGLPCEYSITYSVFRSAKEDFEPSYETQVSSGLVHPTFVAHDPPGSDSYYHVHAVRHSLYCAPPGIYSGSVEVFPLDLGGTYQVEVGANVEDCQASSTSELVCKTLPTFHAVLATQGSHEFLIGCLDLDFESGSWSCVNLTIGRYSVAAHSKTLTMLNAGFAKQNTRTGKTLAPIIPVFSVLNALH